MNIPIYIVDAFAERHFSGNPAAVCPLETWLPDDLLQQIAAQNNLAETAFFVSMGNNYHIRWFTPKAEVDLCGHATLANAHVLFNHLGFEGSEVAFDSRSGILKIVREGNSLVLDFPTDNIERTEIPAVLHKAFRFDPVETWRGRMDYLLIFESQEQVEQAEPVLYLVAQTGTRGVIVSAPGKDVDFVSRYFAPQYGIDEDPVTGSAHTTLIPYWHSKTGKVKMEAAQLSERGGRLSCTYAGDRVKIGGRAITYSTGLIQL